jgi:hypothetical protein
MPCPPTSGSRLSRPHDRIRLARSAARSAGWRHLQEGARSVNAVSIAAGIPPGGELCAARGSRLEAGYQARHLGSPVHFNATATKISQSMLQRCRSHRVRNARSNVDTKQRTIRWPRYARSMCATLKVSQPMTVPILALAHDLSARRTQQKRPLVRRRRLARPLFQAAEAV